MEAVFVGHLVSAFHDLHQAFAAAVSVLRIPIPAARVQSHVSLRLICSVGVESIASRISGG
jgi:hypothetical protein